MKKFSIRTAGRSLFLCLTAVAFLTLAQGEARADEVTIAGSTTGSFSGTTTGLTFAGNSFSVTTEAGFAALSGTDRLGTFQQAPNAGPLSGTFTLNITFSLPSGIAGGQGATYTATVTGSVGADDEGGALLVFDNASRSQTFTFSNGEANGSFTLTLPDFVPVTSGDFAELQGRITGSQTPIPEPATMLLLGTGVAGVAARVRKRRKARAD
jgi:hypothetical protein